jgi:hypothetical protein
MEQEPEHEHHTPKPSSTPFTIRGFMTLSTFSKVVAVSFACCVLLLLRAFLGIGHSAESCGVYAHEVTLGSGFPSESSGSGPGTSDTKSPKDGDKSPDQGEEGERGRVWLEMVDETYNGYQYDWKSGEYGIEYEDDGSDGYDDEYEHEDLLDRV